MFFLMRVLLCKIQCPSFICFCKPSSHIYAAGPLKLEHLPQVSTSTTTVVVDDDDLDHFVDALVEDDVDYVDGLLNEVKEEEEVCAAEEKKEEEEEECQSHGEILKSSLKKDVLDSEDCGGRREKKKKVQWVDLVGKELAEIREFKSSEEEDIRYDGDKSCVCVIL